ncbi:uncharacterized protein BJ212DRAFT_1476183 [Suillus subaureus]|uniref:Uncharacterized protein n=1 Tax=Suillus subaureus TaxID=48587 RepID=A0A9P7JIZ7_9AGAM|nr:uncharacterized protein BJ212DRAFT_1476183 [Suillus subaureus]KAG1824892.1 hypothetical protein BJ212DRAFT_1476183 [Suillus subaureus]
MAVVHTHRTILVPGTKLQPDESESQILNCNAHIIKISSGADHDIPRVGFDPVAGSSLEFHITPLGPICGASQLYVYVSVIRILSGFSVLSTKVRVRPNEEFGPISKLPSKRNASPASPLRPPSQPSDDDLYLMDLDIYDDLLAQADKIEAEALLLATFSKPPGMKGLGSPSLAGKYVGIKSDDSMYADDLDHGKENVPTRTRTVVDEDIIEIFLINVANSSYVISLGQLYHRSLSIVRRPIS